MAIAILGVNPNDNKLSITSNLQFCAAFNKDKAGSLQNASLPPNE